MTTTTEAALTPKADTEGEQVAVKEFRVSDIPAAMKAKGWTEASRIMTKWFNGAPYVMSAKVKSGRTKASELLAEQVLQDLPFEWLFTSSERIKPVVDKIVGQLKNVENYNSKIGRLLTSSPVEKQLSNGLGQLMKRLNELGAIDLEKKELKNGYYDFSGEPAIKLDELSQFNFELVGTSPSEQANDAMDDVYGALGGFAIKMAALRVWTVNQKDVPARIVIDQLGLYVRDTYDFINDGADQFLGYWNESDVRDGANRVTRPFTRLIDAVRRGAESLEDDGVTYYRVTNDSFNRYRETFNKGGDFLIFSTVYKVNVDISIPIGKSDILEFIDRWVK